MKKVLLLLSLLTSIPLIQLSAQKIGITGGIEFNQSDIAYNELSFDKKTGFHAGFLYKQNLILGYAVTGELLYSKKGFKLSHSSDPNGVQGSSYHFDTHNLELPINIRKGFNLLVAEPFIQLGPYVGYALSGKCKVGENDSQSIKYDGSDRIDFGLNFGIGCAVPLGLQASIDYKLGLKDNEIPFGDTGEKVSIKNRQLSVSLAYFF